MGWNPYLTLLEWPRSGILNDHGSREKPNTTFLLKDHYHNITLNDTVIYSYISFCSVIISEVSVDENKYRVPWLDKMKTGKGDIGTLSPKWDCST